MSIYYQDQFKIYNKKKSLIKIGSRLITKKKSIEFLAYYNEIEDQEKHFCYIIL